MKMRSLHSSGPHNHELPWEFLLPTLNIDPLGLRYRTVIRPDQYDDGTIAYIAEIPELPGCRSHGSTVEEAFTNLADAQREYIEALEQRGLPVPAPAPEPINSTVVWRVSFQRSGPTSSVTPAPSVLPT
jgi:predicted RNase H-like HicB family nuclease